MCQNITEYLENYCHIMSSKSYLLLLTVGLPTRFFNVLKLKLSFQFIKRKISLNFDKKFNTFKTQINVPVSLQLE